MSKYSEENISRIGNAAIYIAEHTCDLSKTKLLKLLYLMEERSALKYQQPFLALPYEVWQAGPVAKDIYIDLSDGAVLLSKYLKTELVKLDDGKDAQYIHPVAAFDDEEFSAYEIRLMDEVLKEYGNNTVSFLGQQVSGEIEIDEKGKIKDEIFISLKDCLKNSDAVRKKFKKYI